MIVRTRNQRIQTHSEAAQLQPRVSSAPATPAQMASGAVTQNVFRSRRKALTAEKPVAISQPKTLVVGLGSILSVLGVIVLLAAWGAGLTFMLLFGDRVSERIIAESSQMQDAYEQRLQAYRAEIARLTFEVEQSKFDSTSVEGRVIELARRQRQLEIRLLALKQLSDIVGATAAGSSSAPSPASPQSGAPKPNRIRLESDDDEPVSAVRVIPIQADAPIMEQAPPPREQSTDIDGFILRMQRQLGLADQMQLAILDNLSRYSTVRAERIRSALTLIGLSPEQALQMRSKQSLVIPNIVLPISEQNTPFAKALEHARQNHGLMLGVNTIVDALPTRLPTPVNIRFTSGFGYRIHPIAGTRRLHAGLDMAAPQGTPIYAAGSGVVASAGWGGGYGNLVQIDHGNGIVTRYAHLSQMNVISGQPVAKGSLLGLMGTTGFSTGSHLHFEIRIFGSPVNPACFLLAGDRIAGTQTTPLPCDQPPTWKKMLDEEEDDDN